MEIDHDIDDVMKRCNEQSCMILFEGLADPLHIFFLVGFKVLLRKHPLFMSREISKL